MKRSDTMSRRAGGRIHVLFVSRPIRLALLAPVAGLALLASQGSLAPSGVAYAYSGCHTAHFDALTRTAVLINPTFTVTGTVDATGCGVGVLYYGGHTGKISHATIFGASDESPDGDGDGVLTYDSGTSVTILDSTIQYNNDAGVDVNESSSVTMHGSLVTHDGGRGFDIVTGGSATIDTSSITNITESGVEGDGDGIHSEDATLTVTSSHISNNDDEGVDVFDTTLTMNSDNVTNNHSNGLSLAGSGSTGTIKSTLFTYTKSGEDGDGDGVFLDGAGSTTITGSWMNGNYDDGIDMRGSTDGASIRGSTLAFNPDYVLQADVMKSNGNNGMYVSGAAVAVTTSVFLLNAYGLYLDTSGQAGSTVELTNAVLQQNSSEGAYVDRGSDLSMTSGFIQANYFGLVNYGTTTATRSVLCRNKTGDLYSPGLFINNGTQVCHET
jgi:hypothetical protein